VTDTAQGGAGLQAERLAETIRGMRLPFMLVLPVLALSVAVFYGHVSDHALTAWAGLLLAVYGLRLLFARAYARNPAAAGLRSWLAGLYVLMALSGLAWGGLPLLAAQQSSEGLRTAAIAAVLAVVGFGVRQLSRLPPAFGAFAGGAILPAAIVYASAANVSGLGLFATLLVFLIAMQLQVQRLSRLLEIERSDQERRNELLAARTRITDVLRGVRAATWDLDLRSGRIDLGDAWADLLSESSPEWRMAADQLAERIPAEDLDRSRPALVATLKGQTSEFTVEHRVRADGGRLLWIQTSGRVLERDPRTGRALRVGGLNVDVSERRRAADALAESEARFRDFSRASADQFWELDQQGRFTWISDSLPMAFGISHAEAIGRRIQDIADPAADPQHEEFARYAAAWRARLPFRGLRLRVGGRWGEASGVPVFGPDGAFRGYRGATTDVSARVAVETTLAELNRSLEQRVEERTVELREREQQFRTVTENIPALAVRFDQHVVCRFANAAYARAVGLPPERLVGRTLREILGPGRYAGEQARIEQVLAGSPVQFEQAHHTLPERTLEVMLVPYRRPDGMQDGYFAFAHDVTERKAAEAALEERVRARTADLEAANQEMEAYSYSISHDLRAPARAVAAFSKILATEQAARLDAEGRSLLARVTEAGLRMGQMIDGLLGLAQIKRSALNRQRLDLTTLARVLWEEITAGEPQRRVEFTVEKDLAADADPVLMRSVLQNLLSNAFKYTRHVPHAQVHLGAEQIAGRTTYFVRDNGAGFDMQYAANLFGVFKRLHGYHEFEGTGVGLATVQRIVQRHGGRVWAEAIPGRGAVFRFTLGA